MNLSKALTYSFIGTLILLAGLSILFGSKVFGIFLLLPLGLLFRDRKKSTEPTQSGDCRTADPIEPK